MEYKSRIMDTKPKLMKDSPIKFLQSLIINDDALKIEAIYA